ncbi:hypothetical protein V8F20_001042 [Naviculisporaceae sp. PSN 640]
MQQKMGYDWERSSGGGLLGHMPHQAHRIPDGRSSKHPRRPKPLPEGHFDPDELCRRLYLVLADQKAHAERNERKRRTRAEATDPASSTNINNLNGKPSSDRRREDPTNQSQDGRRPESYPIGSQPSKTATTSADLITELRRTRSSAKHISSKQVVTETNDHEYHHVPKEAAKQFARTTTVDVMQHKERESLVHQLSKRALRFHKQGGRASTDAVTAAPSELNRALRQNQSQRDKILDRNQFQRTRILEEAAHLDHERVKESNRPHTFEREIARIVPDSQKNRRNSTGNTELFDRAPGGSGEHNRKSLVLMDPLLDVDEDSTPEEYPQGRVLAHEHRVDWSQSDESKGKPKLLLSPLLKKADSLWGLRGRLGSKSSPSSSSGGGVPGAGTLGGIEESESGKTSQEQMATTESAVSAPAALPAAPAPKSPTKSPKTSGFFAKFRR